METPVWMQYVDSQISSQYVRPLAPKFGEPVSISIQVPATSSVRHVLLCTVALGRVAKTDMHHNEQAQVFCATVRMPVAEPLQWWFELQDGEHVYYYGTDGVGAYPPPRNLCFTLLGDLKAPMWVADGICYQIYPDRFKNGNPDVGATPGEYDFDGGTVQVMPWDHAPLDFEHGRCLDFYNGDLEGIAQSVTHFKQLGVTVLYLNPIGVSRTTHRYDCCDFFHVDPKLGGDAALAHLIEVMHANGIKVVVDISINHTGTDHPWFVAAQADPNSPEASYYYRKDDDSFEYWEGVPTLPQLNYGSERLRSLIYKDKESVLRKFLQPPFVQDGWRLDVADVVGRFGKDQFCHEIWREVRQAVKETKEDAYILAEDWIDGTDHLGGDEWDAVMNYYGSSRLLRRWMGETDRFELPGWGHYPVPGQPFGGTDLARALGQQLSSMLPQLLYCQFNLIDSHDTPRLHDNHMVENWQRYRGVVMLLYMLPGMPNIYYGDEVGLKGEIGTMEGARYPMQWDTHQWDRRFWDLYVELGQLRKEHSSLGFGAWRILHSDEQTLVFARYDAHDAVVLVLNKADTKRSLCFDAGVLNLRELHPVQSDNEVLLGGSGDVTVVLEPQQSLLLVGIR